MGKVPRFLHQLFLPVSHTRDVGYVSRGDPLVDQNPLQVPTVVLVLAGHPRQVRYLFAQITQFFLVDQTTNLVLHSHVKCFALDGTINIRLSLRGYIRDIYFLLRICVLFPHFRVAGLRLLHDHYISVFYSVVVGILRIVVFALFNFYDLVSMGDFMSRIGNGLLLA